MFSAAKMIASNLLIVLVSITFHFLTCSSIEAMPACCCNSLHFRSLLTSICIYPLSCSTLLATKKLSSRVNLSSMLEIAPPPSLSWRLGISSGSDCNRWLKQKPKRSGVYGTIVFKSTFNYSHVRIKSITKYLPDAVSGCLFELDHGKASWSVLAFQYTESPRLKIIQLTGGTSLYRKYMGVPPSPQVRVSVRV